MNSRGNCLRWSLAIASVFSFLASTSGSYSRSSGEVLEARAAAAVSSAREMRNAHLGPIRDRNACLRSSGFLFEKKVHPEHEAPIFMEFQVMSTVMSVFTDVFAVPVGLAMRCDWVFGTRLNQWRVVEVCASCPQIWRWGSTRPLRRPYSG